MSSEDPHAGGMESGYPHLIRAETGDLSRKIERGKNTTRHCELIPVPDGGMVLDTPGFSLLELPLMEPMELQHGYPEMEDIAGCRFSPCAHISEPDCEFKRRMEQLMSRERYERYKAIYSEMSERWRNRYG